MSQRARRNGSPTSGSTSSSSVGSGGGASSTISSNTGGGGGGTSGCAGMGTVSRLLPMKATVPFQLKPQPTQQQQQGSSPTRNNNSGETGTRTSSRNSRSPTRAANNSSSSCSSPTVGTQTGTSSRNSPTRSTSGGGGSTSRGNSALGSASRLPLLFSHPITVGPGYTAGRINGVGCFGVLLLLIKLIIVLIIRWKSQTSPEVSRTQKLPREEKPQLARVQSYNNVQSLISSRFWVGVLWCITPHSFLLIHQATSRNPHESALLAQNPTNVFIYVYILIRHIINASKLHPSNNNNIRRTSSLDTLAAPYLSGHWPRDSQGQCAPCMRDKATQWRLVESGLGAERRLPQRSSRRVAHMGWCRVRNS
ncbi:F117B protein, partial [Polyodon spathula]|nr:F117B protein [Polyodon spathula]